MAAMSAPLPLLPADPRSLAQGDYMRLRTELANKALQELGTRSHQGAVVVVVGADDVGTFAGFDDGGPLGPNEVRLRYRVSDEGFRKRMHVGAEDMFFEEGQARRFEGARYGEVRVDDGDVVLVGLCDPQRQPL